MQRILLIKDFIKEIASPLIQQSRGQLYPTQKGRNHTGEFE